MNLDKFCEIFLKLINYLIRFLIYLVKNSANIIIIKLIKQLVIEYFQCLSIIFVICDDMIEPFVINTFQIITII